MTVMLLTSQNADHQDMVSGILQSHAKVYKHFGPFDVDLLKAKKVTSVLSDRSNFIITSEIISHLNGRVFNTHPSILPLHRGWQPIFFSVLEGTEVGVSLHQVNNGLDKGPLLAQKKVNIFSDDTLRTIHMRCRIKILELISENTNALIGGDFKLTPQEGRGSYHSKSEFDPLFLRLKNKWDSKIIEVQNLIDNNS